MKTIFTSMLLLLSFSLQAVEFAEVFDVSVRGYEREARIILRYQISDTQFDIKKHEEDMQYVTERLAVLESKHKASPVFKFVQGMHARNMVVFALRKKNPAMQQKWQQKKERYFAEAMNLDKTAKNHLSAAAYADMKKGLDGDLKQQAIAAELELGGNGENESYYWYLHWSNINELQKQGKVAEAEAALEKMLAELSAEGKSAEVYRQIAAKAQKDIEQRKKLQSVKPVPRTFSAPAERDHKAYTEEKVQQEYYTYVFFVILVMLVLAVVYIIVSLIRGKS